MDESIVDYKLGDDMDLPGDGDQQELNDKERFRLYRGLLKFGDFHTRQEDIIIEARLHRTPRELVEMEANSIIRQCRDAAVARDRQAGLNGKRRRRHTKKELDEASKTAGYVTIGGNSVSAVELLARIQLLETLHMAMSQQNPGHPEPWRLKPAIRTDVDPSLIESLRARTTAEDEHSDGEEDRVLLFTLPPQLREFIRDAAQWNVRWTPEDDNALLIGIYKYGFGNWPDMSQDVRLAIPQVVLLKYDKVKQRALRILRHLDSVMHDLQPKGRRGKRRADGMFDFPGKLDSPMHKAYGMGGGKGMMGLGSPGMEMDYYAGTDGEPEICSLVTHMCVSWNVEGQSADVVAALAQTILRGERRLISDMRRVNVDDTLEVDAVINYMRSALPAVGSLIDAVCRRSANSASATILSDALWEVLAEELGVETAELRAAYEVYQAAAVEGAEEGSPLSSAQQSPNAQNNPLASPSLKANSHNNSSTAAYRHSVRQSPLSTPSLSHRGLIPTPMSGPITPSLTPFNGPITANGVTPLMRAMPLSSYMQAPSSLLHGPAVSPLMRHSSRTPLLFHASPSLGKSFDGPPPSPAFSALPGAVTNSF